MKKAVGSTTILILALVGCSTGVFVREAARHGLQACGVDIAHRAIETGRDQGLELHRGTLEDFDASECFDTITAFDLIEHLPAPGTFVRHVAQRLAPGGTFALSTPDLASWIRHLMGRRWYFYIPQEHLYYFDSGTLATLLESNGLEVIASRTAVKIVNLDYSLTQLQEYNPILFFLTKTASFLVPPALRRLPIPLHLGELLMIGRRTDGTAVGTEP